MLQNKFAFSMPTHVYYEYGMATQIGDCINGKNVLIISGSYLYKTGVLEKIGQSMKGKNVTYFTGIEPNPSFETVDKAAQVAREIHADCIVGIGGGSSLDVSKIVSCLASNEGSIYDYYSDGDKSFTTRRVQLICVPTTAGTGSEVTNIGVYTNHKTGIKMPMANEQFWPDCAIIDPELTYTLPAAVTAATGMDAFCHAIEAYWNKNSQPMCDILAMDAMNMILKNIKTAYDDPANKEARGAMILASLVAGIAFSQTRTTGIHAISFPLTTEFGISHGSACAITLPAFIKLSWEKAKNKMNSLAQYLGYDNVENFADSVETLIASMKMPIRLHEIGVKESDLQHITEVGLNAPVIQLTPAVMNYDTVYQLLHSIL